MKLSTCILSLALAAALCGCAQKPAPLKTCIFPGDYPDPSIVRDGNDFYMTHSSFTYFPALLVWHSTDLVHWEPISCALKTYLGSVWAPDIAKVGDKFYIYFTVHNRSDKTVVVKSAKVVIVEGILIYAVPELRELMDIKLFVDTDADVRILRRIRRDVRDRGRSLESVIDQYLTTVKPMHEQFVEPSKRYADLIIPEGGHNQVAMRMVVSRVRAHIYGEEE